MESMGKKRRPCRSFTPEFKAQIVELCQRGDRGLGQVAMDFDLTESAVRDWVEQAGAVRASPASRVLVRLPRGEPLASGGCRHPQACDNFLCQGDPVHVHPLIEAEKQAGHNVIRACELLKASRVAFYARRTAIPRSPRSP